MKCTLHFILTTKVDNQSLINLIIRRINTPVIPSSPGSIDENLDSNFIEALSTASLCLISTLVDLKSEDVMLELFLSFLLPCDHLLVTQKPIFMETDNYGRSAEKFLSLIPGASRRARHRPLVVDKRTGKLPVENTSQNPGGGSLRLTGTGSYLTKQLQNKTASKLQRNFSAPQRRSSEVTMLGTLENSDSNDNPDEDATTEVITLAQFETSFFDYLADARTKIEICYSGVQEWSSNYDGPKGKQGGKLKCKISGSKSSIFSSKSSEANCSAANLTGSDSLYGSRQCLNGKDKDLSPLEDLLEKLEVEARQKNSSSNKNTGEYNVEEYGKYLIEEEKICEEIDEFLNEAELSLKSIDCSDSGYEIGVINEKKIAQKIEMILDSSGCGKNLGNNKNKGPTEKRLLARPSKLSLEKLETLRNGYIDTPTIMDAYRTPDTPLSERSIPTSKSIQSLHEISRKLEPPKPNNANDSCRFSQSMGATEVRTLRSSFSYSGNIYLGPCFNALLIKLEDLCDNSFNTNLVLTGIFASLCSYPLPLLRSFLLNPNLLFQNAVKTLYSVLRKVQTKIEAITDSIDNFQELLLRGRYYFANMDKFGHYSIDEFLADPLVYGSCNTQASTSGLSQLLNSRNGSFNPADNNGESKKSKISDNILGALFRRKNTPKKQAELGFVNSGNTIVHYRSAESLEEARKIRSAVLSVIIVEEFAKELAALAQEHSVFDQISS